MATERELNILIKAKDMASKVLNQYEEQFNQIGKTLLAVGAAGATGLGAAVKVAADFESSMSRVGALSRASEDDMAKLTQTAKDLGASTSFSASQAAEGMQYLAMAGFDVNETIDAMPGLLSTAAAGQLELGQTADIVSNILSGFQIEASETGRVADVLSATFTSSNTNLQMLGETMKYVAPIASAAGMSIEDMAAATGLMGNAGIQGSQAGTSLRAMIMRLQAPTDQAAIAMNNLGIQVRNADGSMKSLPDILAEFESSLSGASKETQDMALKTIIGMEAAAGFQALLNEGSESLRNYSTELQNSGGTAQQIADQQLNNLNGALTILKSGLEGAAIAIGSQFTPYLKVAAEFLTGLVAKFNALDPDLQRKISLFAAIAAGLSLLTGAILIVIPMLPTLAAAVGALLGPVGLVIAALVGLATAFATNFGGIRDKIMSWIQPVINALKYLVGGFDDTIANAAIYGETTESIIGSNAMRLVEIFTRLKNTLTNIFETMTQALTPIVESFGAWLLGFWTNNGEQLISFITDSWSRIQNTVQVITDFIAEMIDTHGKTLINIITNAFESIWSIISSILEKTTLLMDQVWSYIDQLIQDHGAAIVSNVMAAFEGVQKAISVAAEIITSIIDWAFPYIQKIIELVMSQVVPFLLEMFTKISAFIADVMPKIVKVIQWAWEKVIQPLLTGVMNFLVPFIEKMWKAISSIISGVLDIVMGVVKTAMSILTGDWSGAWEGIKQILSGAVQGIKGILKAIATILSAPFKEGIELIKGLGTAFYNVGSDIIKGLINGVKSMARGVVNAAVDAVKGAVNAAKDFLGINSPSRLMMEIGAFTGEGWINGLQDQARAAAKVAEDMAAMSVSPFERAEISPGAYAGSSAAAAGGSTGSTIINLNFGEGSVVLPEVKNGQEFVDQLQGFSLRQAFKSQ